jgi:uncharacterized protein (DUF1778 family)
MPHIRDERKSSQRRERLSIAIDDETKDLIARAADLSQCTINDFCLAALVEAARRTIVEHETMVLSGRDRDAFFNALLNPPEPSERLVRALAEHKRRVGR